LSQETIYNYVKEDLFEVNILMDIPLLRTKIQPPSISTRIIVRDRLIQLINQSKEARLILVSAPAGFGKTTLVNSWLDQTGIPVAWIGLEKEENDLVRFLNYLISALQLIDPLIGQEAQEKLSKPSVISTHAVLTSLINDLQKSNLPIVIVLDDYHSIEAQNIHDAVDFFITHLPEGKRLIAITRADPPFALPRLRVRGQLLEIRQSDLRFTLEEACDYLNRIMGLQLSTNEVDTLKERTEGWIAALQMAAISIRGKSPSPAAQKEFIESFGGSHRFVIDYLVEEVLDQLPADLQDFLLKTSILDRLCANLCDTVVRGFDEAGADSTVISEKRFNLGKSQVVLEFLEKSNLFLIALDDDRTWFRYHRLFSDLLSIRLSQKYADGHLGLHERASIWYERYGFTFEAIEHALESQNYSRAVLLINANVEILLMKSQVVTLLKWLENVPEDLVKQYPEIFYYQTWAMLMCGTPMETIQDRISTIKRMAMDAQTEAIFKGRIATLQAYIFLFQAELKKSIEYSRIALVNLPESDRFLRNVITWILSLTDLQTKDLTESMKILQEVALLGEKTGNLLVTVAALCDKAKVQKRQGLLYSAHDTLEQALRLATDVNGKYLPIASKALYELGDLLLEWNDLPSAKKILTKSIELSKEWSGLAGFYAYFPLARIEAYLGNLDTAEKLIEEANQLALKSDSTQIDDVIADLQSAYFLIYKGDVNGGMKWAENHGLLAGAKQGVFPITNAVEQYVQQHLWKYEQILLAKLYLLKSEPDQALKTLDGLVSLIQELGRVDLNIQVQMLRAIAFFQAGDPKRALIALEQSLKLAEPGGYVRIFIGEGKPMRKLLQIAQQSDILPNYINKLLLAFKGTEIDQEALSNNQAHGQQIEELSDRELEVLKLVEAGMNTNLIADTLVIAVSTVRSHYKQIYAKLNAHSRIEAVQRAKNLGII